MTAAQVRGATLTTTQFRPGCDEQDVDRLVADIVDTLESVEQGRYTPPPPAPGPAVAPREPWTTRLGRMLRGDPR